MAPTQSESTGEYVPGLANGKNYMARLCKLPDGRWSIDVIHVESLAPLHGSAASWLTREEAANAAGLTVAALAG
jgi:hypothetical protein